MLTLRDLLNRYRVVIPKIQRDYAQGRHSELNLRKGFVNKIGQILQDDNEKLNLDFIYGYTESAGEDIFIPLDGQQRLTTLWLIHWFLAPRVGNELMENDKAYLSKFTYETRLSSKRFCNSLINKPLEIKEGVAISEQIMDVHWFMSSWSNDLTVLGMLNMLDTLQEHFLYKDKAWRRLTEDYSITFDFIDIKSEEFKLTDELYIKMNSRGKPLTRFENFKAQFSNLLASDKTDYAKAFLKYETKSVSYREYFAFKIDSVWMDLFWRYKTENVPDDSIYRFINFVAEFMFLRNNPEATNLDIRTDFDFLNAVFSKKENVDFLFDSLDFITSLNDVDSFFRNIFEEVSTFDQEPADYFLRVITDKGFDVKDKIILYSLLSYCNKADGSIEDQELKDFMRVVRNLLFSVRQPNQSKRIEYTSNLRLPNVSEYCKFIDSFVQKKNDKVRKTVYQILSENDFEGFANDSIQHEKIKASLIVKYPDLKESIHQLESHSQLKGNISNFNLESADLKHLVETFLTIWNGNTDNSLIIRAFLAVADYSVITHNYSALDEIRFFGCTDNWNRILTAANKEERAYIKTSLECFLLTYSRALGANAAEKLQYMIDNFNAAEKDWRYYFVKYKTITANRDRNQNVYTWQDKKGFDINQLGNSGTLPLHSYHVNPYLLVLDQCFNTNENVRLNWGRFTDLSYLTVDSKFTIKCKSSGWQITPIQDWTMDERLISNYKLVSEASDYWLKDSEAKDRIQVAIDFLNDALE